MKALPEISDAARAVLPAIRRASEKTGVDFGYLVAAARRESNFDATARAATSSAAGLFQFIEQTWLRMVKQYGAQHGLAAAAEAIRPRGEGGYEVADPAMRRRILDMRFEPDKAAAMAGELSSENARALGAALGRPVRRGDLYAAHFLGARGAQALIELAERDPQAPAAALFKTEAAANRSVFFDPAGRAKSARDVYAFLTQADEGGAAAARLADAGPGAAGAAAQPPTPPGAGAWKLTPAALAALLSLDPLSILRNSRR